MSWMPSAATSEVYRATIVVEQRSLTDDHLIQTWSNHSKSYAKPQGATMWLNEQIYDIGRVAKEVLDERDQGIISRAGTYEQVAAGTGIFIATAWEPYIKKKDRK